MDSPTRQPEAPFGDKLESMFMRLALAVALVGGLFLAFRYFGYDQLNEEIRRRAEEKLQIAYPGLHVRVNGARRMGDHGFELYNIRVAEGGGHEGTAILEIHSLTAACNTKLPEFLTQPYEITNVKIHGFKLRAERKSSGVWNASHLLPLPTPEGQPHPVTIEDGLVELVDPQCSTGVPLVLRNIKLELTPQDSPTGCRKTFQGSLTGDHFDRATIQGSLSPAGGAWELSGAVEGLEFTPRLRAALCGDWQKRLESLASIRGRTRFGFQLSGDGTDAPPQCSLAGEIAEGRVDDARLPDPLTDLSARIQVDGQGLVIEELSARMGAATIELSGKLGDLEFKRPANLQLTGNRLSLDRLPWDLLPAPLKEIRDGFAPQGEIDAKVRLSFDGRTWSRQGTLEARQLSLKYASFPYPFTNGSGQIICTGETCDVNITGVAGGRRVVCQAKLLQQIGGLVGRMDVHSEGPLPIDEQLLTALPAGVEATARSLRPRGAVAVTARFERARPEENYSSHYELTLHDCSVLPEKFRYPLDKIAGRIVGDNGRWQFQEINGRNDSGYVVCNGTWDVGPHDAGQLALTFTATDLPLEDELRQALSPAVQRLWDGLRPRGNLDHVRAELKYDAQRNLTSFEADVQKWPASQNVPGRAVSLEPAWLPVRLDQVTGAFIYRGGELELKKVKAACGKATVEVEGHCRPDEDGGWTVELGRVVGDHFVVDETLLAGLPSRAAKTLADLRFSGTVGGQGAVTVRIPAANGKTSLAWDVSADLENARLECSRPVEHVCGGIKVRGQATGDEIAARGEMTFDSLQVDGVQVTDVKGPFQIDSRQFIAGAWCPVGEGGTLKQVTGKTFKGQLQLDAYVSLAEDGRFALQTTLEGADLQAVTRDLLPRQQGLTGRASAMLQLEGTTRGSHTWRGAGKVRLQEAELSRAPLAVALMKLLTEKAVFTSSNADFRVQGDDVEFARLDFNGDAVCLKGRGRMQLSSPRKLDLQFYSQMGRDELQLPILRPLLGAASKHFLLVEVTGTADQPDVKKTVMPGLNERLRNLFPELAEGASPAMQPPPLLATPRELLDRARDGTRTIGPR